MQREIVPRSLGFINNSSGIQFGYGLKKKKVKKVMVTTFPSISSISKAISRKINLIIAYYPIEGAPFWEIKENLAIKLAMLATGRIVLYVLNRTFEAIDDGFIDILLDKLFLRKEALFYSNNLNGEKIPLGRICSSKSLRGINKTFLLRNLLVRIKDNLSAEYFRYVGDEDHKVTRMCVINSISRDLMLKAIDHDCQCYITRDINYLDALFAKDLNLCLIEIGHYAEKYVLKELTNRFSLDFPMIAFYYHDSENPISNFYDKSDVC